MNFADLRLAGAVKLAAAILLALAFGANAAPGASTETLRFAIMRNDTMEIALGGTTGAAIPFPPVQLRAPDGTPNQQSVVAAAACTGR